MRRERIRRGMRMAMLASRRGAHWLLVKLRGVATTAERRRKLDEQYALRSAADVTKELGAMKGVVMKLGQLVSFVAEGLPDEAQETLAALQADVPPMAPGLAAEVVERELGALPERLFLDWEDVPVAAASVGQVHKAVMWDGRQVAVKVQYPGISDAIESDLANARWLYGLLSQFSFKSVDVEALVEELRLRIRDELDYRIEAKNQTGFADRYKGHPFIHVPSVVADRSSRRVLTTDWVDRLSWQQFEPIATGDVAQRAAEVVFRFVQAGVHRYGVFNGDSHPGNYLFDEDGNVTFIDFGLVKTWAPGESEVLMQLLDRVLENDPAGAMEAMVDGGFLAVDHELDQEVVWLYVSAPYVPFLTERFTYSREFVADALSTLLDLRGPGADVVKQLKMPPSFVILDRVVWGVSALLGRLGAEGPWRAIVREYRHGAPPATELGRIEAAWFHSKRRVSSSESIS